VLSTLNVYVRWFAQRVISFQNSKEVKQTGIPKSSSGRNSLGGVSMLITDAYKEVLLITNSVW